MKRCLVAVLVVLCVSGCGANAGPPSASDPPTTVVTSVSPTGPVAPVMPAVARERTKAGAIAFARYYWAVVDYAQRVVATAELRKLSAPGCAACNGGADWIDSIGARHGRISGGTHRVHGFWAPRPPIYGQIALIGGVRVSRQVVSSAGSFNRTYAAGVDNISMTLRFSAGRWAVASWHVN